MKPGKRLGGKPPRRGGRLTRTRAERAHRPVNWQLIGVLVAGFLVLGVFGGFAWGMDRQLRGGLLQQRTEAMQRPDWTPLASLPAYVAQAFVLVVEPDFEDGIRLRGRDEALTIARDLVKQVHLLGNGLAGEARELVMAPVIEQRMTKAQLLEFYLNRVYLGRFQDYPVYGVHIAAAEYFGKSPQELTLGEAATLAGLLLRPRIDRPEERPGAVGVRRNEVLRSMLRAGLITPDQHASAVAERLAFQPGLTEIPMTRRFPTEADTAVIRLPPEYRPALEEAPD